MASLREQLRRGAKSLAGNRGYQRYVRVCGEGFAIDEAQVAAEARYDGNWVLQADQEKLSAVEVAWKYKQLWMIDELFRDHKDRRNGVALRETRIRSPKNLSRSLSILVLACISLLDIELHAKRHCKPSNWVSTSRARHYSLFTIGQRMLDRVQLQIPTMDRAVCCAILEACEKWG